MSDKPYAVVTGGAGFIGSHTVDLLLDRGYRVRVVDNLTGGRELNLAHHGDSRDLIRDIRDIRAIAPDDEAFVGATSVIHFAGIGDIVPSIERPLEYMSVNVQGTAQVLEASRHAGVKKFVYAASSSCYGLASTPTREDHPIRGRRADTPHHREEREDAEHPLLVLERHKHGQHDGGAEVICPLIKRHHPGHLSLLFTLTEEATHPRRLP